MQTVPIAIASTPSTAEQHDEPRSDQLGHEGERHLLHDERPLADPQRAVGHDVVAHDHDVDAVLHLPFDGDGLPVILSGILLNVSDLGGQILRVLLILIFKIYMC